MHKTRSVVYFLMAIANIFISIPLIRRCSEVGAAAGTTISLLVANICFMNWYYHNKIHLDIIYFWKNILSMCKGLIFPVVVGVCILMFVNTNGMIRFFLFVGIYTMIYAISMWFFGMNKAERSQFKGISKRFGRR